MWNHSQSKLSRFSSCPAYFFFVDVLGLEEMKSYPMLLGEAGHEAVRQYHAHNTDNLATEKMPLTELLDKFDEAWAELLEINAGKLEKESVEEEQVYEQRGKRGLTNYWQRVFEKEEPVDVESFRRPEFKGINFIVKFDQFRLIPKEDRPKWRPDLAWRKRLPGRVIVDLKFGRKAPYPKSESGSVFRLKKSQLTTDLRRQGGLYTLAYRCLYNHLPLGFSPYYVIEDNMGFVDDFDEEDFSHLVNEAQKVVDHMAREDYPRNLGPKCDHCVFKPDCLGGSRELIDTEVTQLPVVSRGVSSWQLERGLGENAQSRFLF